MHKRLQNKDKRLQDRGFRREKAVGRLRPCRVCLGDFRPYRKKQESCSSRCRLLYWYAVKVLEAYRAGRADGLKETIEKLAGGSTGPHMSSFLLSRPARLPVFKDKR